MCQGGAAKPRNARSTLRLTSGRALAHASTNAEACRVHGLATADVIVFATARARDAALITCDAHFDGLPGRDADREGRAPVLMPQPRRDSCPVSRNASAVTEGAGRPRAGRMTGGADDGRGG